MKNAIKRSITSRSSQTKKAFLGLWKQWKIAKVMQIFVEFWGGIWEQNEPTPNMSSMEEMKAELG